MNKISWFVFYFRLPDGTKVDVEIIGKTFEKCLESAQKRATQSKAKIVAWVEL